MSKAKPVCVFVKYSGFSNTRSMAGNIVFRFANRRNFSLREIERHLTEKYKCQVLIDFYSEITLA